MPAARLGAGLADVLAPHCDDTVWPRLWAWLLDRWGARRGDPRGHEAARKLFAAGRLGFDAARKVAINALWDDMTVAEADARLWPQTEYLKAALRLGQDADALLAAQGLVAYLDKPAPGAWRDVLRPDGSFVDQPAPATSFYHLAGAIFALIARPTSSNARA